MRIVRSQRGSVMAEFIMTAGITVLILLATIELGLMFHTRLILVSAAREGARRAAIEGGNTEGTRRAIRDQLSLAPLDLNLASVSITPNTASYGTLITVTISYPYRFTTPAMQALAGSEVRLRSTVITRSEKVR
ncbi:MAG: TadE family protein [Bacillota bacterium]